MIVVETVSELRKALSENPRPLGLVPTMGALHEGHISLARRARDENKTVAMTIFVNPTQFGPNEDFARYPRTLENDLSLAREAGVDLMFTPPVDEMYPPGFATEVTVSGVTDRWEGAARPGHFSGVATVVARLLLLFGAENAYFGEKDYQQLQVIKRMVRDLAIPSAIQGCPIIRESDGLAMSSRNRFLDTGSRARAIGLLQALQCGKKMHDRGERSAASINSEMRRTAELAGLEVEYLAVVHEESLEPLEVVGDRARIIGVVKCGGVRLLDNIAI